MPRFLRIDTVEETLASRWPRLSRKEVLSAVAKELGPLLFKPERTSRIDIDGKRVTLFMHSSLDGERYWISIGPTFKTEGSGFDMVRVDS